MGLGDWGQLCMPFAKTVGHYPVGYSSSRVQISSGSSRVLVYPRAGGREFGLLNRTKILMMSFRWLDISVSVRPRRSSVPVSRTRKK